MKAHEMCWAAVCTSIDADTDQVLFLATVWTRFDEGRQENGTNVWVTSRGTCRYAGCRDLDEKWDGGDVDAFRWRWAGRRRGGLVSATTGGMTLPTSRGHREVSVGTLFQWIWIRNGMAATWTRFGGDGRGTLFQWIWIRNETLAGRTCFGDDGQNNFTNGSGTSRGTCSFVGSKDLVEKWMSLTPQSKAVLFGHIAIEAATARTRSGDDRMGSLPNTRERREAPVGSLDQRIWVKDGGDTDLPRQWKSRVLYQHPEEVQRWP
ncbi:hypothetical protein B0H10DRAFT_1964390 [Mycena sp. CBHHK59/15]|nr:hypothetical protein B0H10DRAFT_1964390 [Mycena sp. CBHHK59/15]